MIDFKRLFDTKGVENITSGKNCQEGWVAIKCIYCDDPSQHLGFCRKDGKVNCWRCGGKRLEYTIAKLLHVDCNEAKRIIKQYSTGFATIATMAEEHNAPDYVKLPEDARPLTKEHKLYLAKRGFDANELEKDWGLLGTSNTGKYKFRIIAPVYLKGQLVTFQGRDITGTASSRYLSCPRKESIVHIKNTLYGIDDTTPGGKCIVVEGITDVWRLGKGKSIATFGTSMSKKNQAQIKLLAEQEFSNIFVLFDKEEDAQEKAQKLITAVIPYLSRHTSIENVVLNSAPDPAELNQQQVNTVLKSLGF